MTAAASRSPCEAVSHLSRATHWSSPVWCSVWGPRSAWAAPGWTPGGPDTRPAPAGCAPSDPGAPHPAAEANTRAAISAMQCDLTNASVKDKKEKEKHTKRHPSSSIQLQHKPPRSPRSSAALDPAPDTDCSTPEDAEETLPQPWLSSAWQLHRSKAMFVKKKKKKMTSAANRLRWHHGGYFSGDRHSWLAS